MLSLPTKNMGQSEQQYYLKCTSPKVPNPSRCPMVQANTTSLYKFQFAAEKHTFVAHIYLFIYIFFIRV